MFLPSSVIVMFYRRLKEFVYNVVYSDSNNWILSFFFRLWLEKSVKREWFEEDWILNIFFFSFLMGIKVLKYFEEIWRLLKISIFFQSLEFFSIKSFIVFTCFKLCGNRKKWSKNQIDLSLTIKEYVLQKIFFKISRKFSTFWPLL